MQGSSSSAAKSNADLLKERQGREEKRLNEQLGVLQLELQGLAEEHAELADTWKIVDTKAQITATTAGIFLGGVFAIQRVPQLAMPDSEKWFLAGALALLVISIICALRTLELRNVRFPPRGTSSSEGFRDLYGTDEFAAGGAGLCERIIRYRRHQVRTWETINLQTLATLKSKGRWTMAAQYLFGMGALVFAGLSVYELFKPPATSLMGNV